MCKTPYGFSACFNLLLIFTSICYSGYPVESRAMSLSTSSAMGRRLHSPNYPNNNHEIHHNNNNNNKNHSRSNKIRHRGRGRCEDYDVSWKAYKAPGVVRALVESKKCDEDACTFHFKILQSIKEIKPFQVDERVPLRLARTNNSCNGLPHFLVKDNKDKYLLFLNSTGAHMYSSVFTPVRLNKKNQNKIKIAERAARMSKPKRVVLRITNDSKKSKNPKLTCRVQGFPIPKLVWKHNGTQVKKKFLEKNRRNITLKLGEFNYSSSDKFSCGAYDVDGQYFEQIFIPTPHIPPTKKQAECTGNLNKNYCQNGGRCFMTEVNEIGCECAPGFDGTRCEIKTSEVSSRYHHPTLYTCTEGIFTKNDDC